MRGSLLVWSNLPAPRKRRAWPGTFDGYSTSFGLQDEIGVRVIEAAGPGQLETEGVESKDGRSEGAPVAFSPHRYG